MHTSQFLEEDLTKSKLKSTGASIFHKAVGRQTSAAWGNRIVKDFYDLDYEVPSHLQRLGLSFKNKQIEQRKRVRDNINRSKLSSRKISLNDKYQNQTISLHSPGKSKSKDEKRTKNNPQSIEIGALAGSSCNQLGLSVFEYKNTIQGKMQNRLNHHLSFEKSRVNRILNQNPIYYDRHDDLDFSHSKLMNDRRTIKKYHPFYSYTTRKVFQPKQQLDKFFDTDEGRRAVSPKRLKSATRKFEKVIGRQQSKLNESALLAYETLPAVLKLKKKSLSYSIQKTEREFTFSPQIFSDKRGCYR